MLRAPRATVLIAALVLAGCAAPAGEETPAPTRLPDLSDVPPPPIDVERARLWWETFVRAHPMRVTQSPTNALAAQALGAALAEAGYEAREIHYLPPGGAESPVPQGIRTVYGVKRGTVEPDRVVAWVAHYDSNPATIYAAYDDGSGTAVALELARALAAHPNRKTLMPIFFDAEEIGLVASQYFVQQALDSGTATFDLVIGHDMTGINCPGHEWPMYQMMGENYAADLRPVVEELYAKVLGEDLRCVVLLDVHDRNSDERRFKEAGFPVLRMAGGRNATDYPAYHKPNDTVEFVYGFTGGPENFGRGLALTLVASYWNVVTFDRLAAPAGRPEPSPAPP